VRSNKILAKAEMVHRTLLHGILYLKVMDFQHRDNVMFTQFAAKLLIALLDHQNGTMSISPLIK